MELKDREGQLRIKFSGFKKQGNSNPVFINTFVEISMENSSAKELIAIELLDIEELIKNSTKLYESLKGSFYFQPIDDQLQIRFESLPTGSIKVTGFLKDKLYQNTLNFFFEMTSSELLEMIKEGENIFDVLN